MFWRFGNLQANKFLLALSVTLWVAVGAHAQVSGNAGWGNYGGDPGGARYSPANQINRGNVEKLRLAWSYRTGALEQKTELVRKAAFEATPILAENKLFLSRRYHPVLPVDPK